MSSLSADTHCEMITQHIRDCNKRISDSFKLFVQLFSAIVGASVWLSLQTTTAPKGTFAWLADGISFLALVVCAVTIIDNLRAWHNYRAALSKVAGKDKSGKLIVPPPKLRTAATVETAMLVVMLISWVLFTCFNPLKL